MQDFSGWLSFVQEACGFAKPLKILHLLQKYPQPLP
jgi:hypothetical protein